MAPFSDWDILGAGERFLLKVDVLEAGKMFSLRYLNEFDEGQTVMAVEHLQNLNLVPGLQWSVSLKSGPKKEKW